jgi:hypothetical protein
MRICGKEVFLVFMYEVLGYIEMGLGSIICLATPTRPQRFPLSDWMHGRELRREAKSHLPSTNKSIFFEQTQNQYPQI